MARAKRLRPEVWKTGHAPTDKDWLIQAAWLDEHAGYGGRIHEVTADVLVAALKEPTTRGVGHALYLKLFAEYGNALEVAGAWGWVMRTRRAHPLLLDAFLTYPSSAPRDFYRAARRNRSGSLIRLLNLPSESKVVSALATEIPDWTEDQCRLSLVDCVRQAKFLADQFFGGDEIIRTTYNRAKHGATLLHRGMSLPLHQFYVVSPHLEIRGPRDKARYDMPKVTVDRTMILSAERGILIAGSMIRYLAHLAKALNRAGSL